MAKWLTTKQAADKLQVKPRSLTEYLSLRPGFPKPSKPNGRRLLWNESELEQWIERGRIRATSPGTKRGDAQTSRQPTHAAGAK